VKIAAGQTLVLARRKSDGAWELTDITVTKVGRVWAYLVNGERFSIETGRAYDYDGGRVFESREAFEAEQTRGEKWTRFQGRVRNLYGPPAHITTRMIEQAAAALEIELS
jgi:hypothetical protein